MDIVPTMKQVATVVVVGMLALVVQGCATGGGRGPSRVQVSVLTDGRASVEGRVVAMEEMAGLLKAVGASASTTIAVELPQALPQAELMRITGLLRRAGYVRVIFKRPRRAEALTE